MSNEEYVIEVWCSALCYTIWPTLFEAILIIKSVHYDNKSIINSIDFYFYIDGMKNISRTIMHKNINRMKINMKL